MKDFDERLDFSAATAAQPALWLPRMQRLVRDQSALSRRLEALARETLTVADEGEPEALAPVLDQRDAVLREMSLIAYDLRPMADAFTALAASLTDEQSRSVRAEVAALDQHLVSVAALDDEARARLESRRHELSKELAGLSTARSASALYAPAKSNSAAPQSHDLEA